MPDFHGPIEALSKFTLLVSAPEVLNIVLDLKLSTRQHTNILGNPSSGIVGVTYTTVVRAADMSRDVDKGEKNTNVSKVNVWEQKSVHKTGSYHGIVI